LRTIVLPEGLLAANALMMQAFYIVRLLSPAAAGALVAWLTEKSCFYLDVASFIFSAAMIFETSGIDCGGWRGCQKQSCSTAESVRL
jgi:hypothetical protein